ncbi:tetratricopeptide repeat-containing sensor histidine kinase [Chryseobacterium sp. SL1]|uniref:tetratricopeptide repeat-containing sensor histidine kinase n=1 Tax=Chryseobacterium sp. SL1 TaxID=2995159 RepID=UPI002276346F|nr:tetratricopeptide repeat protein [Chryseobacterium sp. SL1]MCY1660123.1 tetratricopeptide repeat protein [Chryseobacterium sp. SL1]
MMFRTFLKSLFYFFLALLWVQCSDHADKTKSIVLTDKQTIKEILQILKKASQNSDSVAVKRQLQTAEKLCLQIQNDSLLLKVRELRSQLYYSSGDKEKFKAENRSIISFARQKGLKKIESKSHFNIGNYYFEQSRYDSAYAEYAQSKALAVVVKDYKRAASCKANMAIIQTTVGDYNGSEQTSVEGLKLVPTSEKNIKLSLYNNLGVVSDELGEYDDAVHWYFEALKLSDDSLQKLVFNNNIGLVYKNKSNFAKALPYLKKAQDFSDNIRYPDYAAMAEDNLGFVKHKLKQPDALEIMGKAYDKRKKINDLSGIIASELHLAEYWKDQENIPESVKYLESALNNTLIVKDIKNRIKVLSFLSEMTGQRNHISEYIRLNDSIQLSGRQWKNQFAKIRFRTEEKEKENDVLKNENLKQKLDLQKQHYKNQRYILISLLLFVLVISLSIYLYQFRKIQKQKLWIQKIKAGEEEKNKMSMLLHDDLAGEVLLGLQKGEKLIRKTQNEDWKPILDSFENVYEKMRKISQGYSSTDFEKIPFEKKLLSLVYEYQQAGNYTITVSGMETIEWSAILREIKVAILSIIQEAFTNVLKHSNADQVTLDFRSGKKCIRIHISDNGTPLQHNNPEKGVGLKHLETRIMEMGGTLHIAGDETGWNLQIEIPYEK